jgi:S-adenosylmethionine:tRNA ribosyltransferase-isomerase
MLTADFDYDLPPELIAQRALPRGESRLLVLDADGPSRHRSIADLPALLKPGDLLVVNNTRVIPARLFARRETGGRVELLLVEKLSERDWTALLKPGRRARPGSRLRLDADLGAEVMAKFEDGRHHIRFSEPVDAHLERLGHVPLPPYIKRADAEDDSERYQTVYASVAGAIAAPTAGLHFTPELLAGLREQGIPVVEITLHVGIGTFKPVTATLVHEHAMEVEHYRVSPSVVAAVEQARARGGRVIAVGTTVVRTLESAVRADGSLPAGEGSSDLFITPGYRFKVVDLLLTNFHLPKSTLLMLVSAFAGRERILAAYREAIEAKYRFYSYGDAMLLQRATAT